MDVSGHSERVVSMALRAGVIGVFVLASVALAQGTNAPPAAAGSPAAMATTAATWDALIVLFVPIVVNSFKKAAADRLPKLAWPLIAVALGILADWVLAQAGAIAGSSWRLGALCGGAGIGLREISKQVLALVSMEILETQSEPPKLRVLTAPVPPVKPPGV